MMATIVQPNSQPNVTDSIGAQLKVKKYLMNNVFTINVVILGC